MYKKLTSTVLLLFIAFLASGAGALIYQIVWLKKLSLTFGSSTLAVATVLACFMGGLAIGSFLMGQKSLSIKRSILVYGLVEVTIGIYAFLLPYIFDLTDFIYRFIWPLTAGNYYGIAFLRFLLAFSILILPTSLMGATLPLLVRFYIDREEIITKYLGVLYGINTLGAVIGALLSGFILIEAIGVYDTNLVGVSLSFIAGGIALYLDKKETGLPIKLDIIQKVTLTFPKITLKQDVIVWAMFFSGFTAMVYEVVWARQLVLIYGSTTYAYTGMLVVFLVGITLGSFVASKITNYSSKNKYIFALLQLSIGLIVLWGTFYYNSLFYIYYDIWLAFSKASAILPILVVSSLLIFPVAFIFGLLFPLAIRIHAQSHHEVARDAGYVYSMNTIGCILGSVFSGFIFIPLFGMHISLIIAAFINIIIALTLLLSYENTVKKRLVITTIAVLILITFSFIRADWKKEIMSVGLYVNNYLYNTKVNVNNYFENVMKYAKLAYYKEGFHSTIAVREFVNEEKQIVDYTLTNNGKNDASTTLRDIRTQTMLGYLPGLIKKKINTAAIVGMGSGQTASALLKFPVKSVDVIELEKAILETAEFFKMHYGNPLKDPRVNVIIDDARNFLRVTDKKYDLIISEPSNVWVSGVSTLFTEDYYEIIEQKLHKDGILVQWIQTYALKPAHIFSVIKALKNTFPYVYIFHSKTGHDFLFVATNEELQLDLNLIESRLSIPFVQEDLKNVFMIENAYEVLSLFLIDTNTPESKKLFSVVKPNTDNNCYLEFAATKSFLEEAKIHESMPIELFLPLNGGITRNLVQNPPLEFYKSLVINLSAMLNRTIPSQRMEDAFEAPLLKQQMLKYAYLNMQTNPNLPESYDLLGAVYMDNNDLENALTNLQKAIELGSNDTRTYIILSQIYNQLLFPDSNVFNPHKALEYALKAKTNEPQNPFIDYILGVSYYHTKNYQEAVKHLNSYYLTSQKANEVLNEDFYLFYAKASLGLEAS